MKKKNHLNFIEIIKNIKNNEKLNNNSNTKKQQRKLNRIPEHAYTGSGSFMALDSRKISTEMTLKRIE